MLVYVIKAKNNNKVGNAGYIHAHGGGGVLGNAKGENMMMCRIACESDVVVFNVEYRLAPEHKTPSAG